MTLTETTPGHWLAVGELTFATCSDCWLPLQDCLSSDSQAGDTAAGNRPPAERLQLDVSGLTRIDSAGLATLVAWLSSATCRQISVQLLGPTEQLLQLARVGGVDTVLPLHWQTTVAATG